MTILTKVLQKHEAALLPTKLQACRQGRPLVVEVVQKDEYVTEGSQAREETPGLPMPAAKVG
eukprot:CAMPEP_0177455804 /NCGR_PEP_ID=MMETSP0369-20130122/12109_1 /TAXON_ID=447022 ORGANISM="Scrippsiella hangoei-like, Strain SHHI-4" /NCGR_SAMPLE_ID=MMETSP0369 /ASSEMBLY_ACC=CAM_ASM_000364 /LENGTH=61 /DNA_ID=CAMNT_0018928713 /DNA_START=165 /DNA_END=350 /DNA_ORIENTATION=-